MQLLKKDPKPLVVFSVAVDTTMLFSCTSFWMFMAVISKRFGFVGCQASRKDFVAGAELGCRGMRVVV